VIFKLVTSANSTLSDPTKRAEYDRRRTLGAFGSGGSGGSSTGFGAGAPAAAYNAHAAHVRPFGSGAAAAAAGGGGGAATGGAHRWHYSATQHSNPWRYAAGGAPVP